MLELRSGGDRCSGADLACPSDCRVRTPWFGKAYCAAKKSDSPCVSRLRDACASDGWWHDPLNDLDHGDVCRKGDLIKCPGDCRPLRVPGVLMVLRFVEALPFPCQLCRSCRCTSATMAAVPR